MARTKPTVILSRKVANPIRDQKLRNQGSAKRKKARVVHKLPAVKKPAAPLNHDRPEDLPKVTGLRTFIQAREQRVS